MSQFPPPYEPLGYASAPLPDPNRRPAAVTVIAIIGIIFASLGLLSGLCTIPQIFGVQFFPNPARNAMRSDRLLHFYSLISIFVGFAMAALLLWASIGLLKLKSAARTAIVWYALVYIVVIVIQVVLAVCIVNSRMQRITQATLAGMPGFNTPIAKQTIQYGAYVRLGFSVLFLVWPALILYFMNQPVVKTAFAKKSD